MEVDGHERYINWLKDDNLLPGSIPASRIMSFNYESKWFLDAPKQSLSSCAIQLLTALDNLRKTVIILEVISSLTCLIVNRIKLRHTDH